VNRIEAFGYIAAQAARGEISFPTSVNAVLRLQQALNDPDCHLENAIRLVLGEPQLAARTVALANSSAFNAGNRPITNVRAAVMRIGYRNLQMLVASLVVRQFGSCIQDPDLRDKAEQLWEHTVQVAALAQVFARRVTFVNPDTAMFAGIVHEVAAFYLLTRADEFPGLLDDDDDDRWGELCEDVVMRDVARRLSLPEPVSDAIFDLRGSWLHMPPSSLLDTLLLANLYAEVPSPLGKHVKLPDHNDSALDYLVDEDSLHAIIHEAAELADSMGQAVLV
jgi:HD-like signal output (HDOD) protein